MMINYTPAPKPKTSLIWIVVAASVGLHFALYAAMPSIIDRVKDSYIVSFALNEIKPPPPPPPPEKKEEEKPKPKPKPEEKPLPNAQTDNKPIDNKEPPPVVQGLTKDSFSEEGDSGMLMRAGNTLMKEMDKKFIDPNAVKELPKGNVEPPEKKVVVAQHKLTKQVKVRKLVKPEYTKEAKEAEVEGTVLLRITIDETGKVVNVTVEKTIGYGLEKAAIEAIKKTEFEPGYVGDKPVLTTVLLPVRFVLED